MRFSLFPLVAAASLGWTGPALAQHAGHGAGGSTNGGDHARSHDQKPSSLLPPTLPTGPRQVRVTITQDGFTPKEIDAEAGDSVVLVITRLTSATCARELNFFGRGLQVALPEGQEIKITVDVNEVGILRFGCLSGAEGAVIRIAENRRP